MTNSEKLSFAVLQAYASNIRDLIARQLNDLDSSFKTGKWVEMVAKNPNGTHIVKTPELGGRLTEPSVPICFISAGINDDQISRYIASVEPRSIQLLFDYIRELESRTNIAPATTMDLQEYVNTDPAFTK